MKADRVPTLRELEAQLLRITSINTFEHVELVRHAQGVTFLCPKCYIARGCSKYGVHSVICWFAHRNVPPHLPPAPGRWNPSPSSTSIDDLEFIGPGSFSVQLTSGCMWRGYIKGGRATILPS